MKNKEYIRYLLFIIIAGISFRASCQNTLLQTNTLPASPFGGGSTVQIDFDMSFVQTTGEYKQIKIVYDHTKLQFVSTNLSSLFVSPPTIISGTTTTLLYKTNPFSVADNNYLDISTFSVNFRVISPSCSPVTTNVDVSLSTFPPSLIETDIQTTSTSINIQNTNSNPTVSIDLSSGIECKTAIYRINSFGFEDATHNGSLNLKMPQCATAQVYNAAGNLIPFTQTSSGGFTTYSWQRSGTTNELNYVVVDFNCAICSQLDLTFNSYTICGHLPYNTTLSPARLFSCCSTPPVGFPSTPNACPVVFDDDYQGSCCAEIVLPANSSSCSGGSVVLSQWLVKTPFRYLPCPDNCRTHDYYIKIDNFSCYELSNLKIADLISSIVASYPAAVLVTDVSVSLSSLLPASGTFSFTVAPTLSIPSIAVMGGSAVSGNYGTWSTCPATTNTWPGGDLNINGIPNSNLPKFSSLLIKITHALNTQVIPATLAYNNQVNLDFDADNIHYKDSVTCTSYQDAYEPVITIDKKVRNLLPTPGAFASAVSANPGETVEFQIKIRNYGLKPVPVNFTDVITNQFTNLNNISQVTVTGLGYTSGQLSVIQSSINAHIIVAGINLTTIQVLSGACLGYSEITITFNAQVKSTANCNSVYTDTAKINWTWPYPVTSVSAPHTASSVATVNVDLFKNIRFKLEATCVAYNAPDVDWHIGNINAVPGQTIWYRATVNNNNNYAVNGLKMMLQFPNSTLSSNTTTHNVPPLVTLVSNYTAVPPPGSTGLFPTLSSGSPIFSNTATNNWLSGTPPLIPNSGGKKAWYKSFNLGPYGTTTILYSVVTPINSIGASYNTAMGVSMGSASGPGGASCPIVRQRNLNLTIVPCNPCGCISGCNSLLFDSKIVLSGSALQITLFNILDFLGSASPNINNMDIVIHQPYNNCVITSAPYNRQMIGYERAWVNPTTTYSGFTLIPGVTTDRIIKLTNVISPVNFGNVTFYIGMPNPFAGPVGCRILPLNIIFKDNDTPCTLCERMIYLKF